jgi:hypothetical protein
MMMIWEDGDKQCIIIDEIGPIFNATVDLTTHRGSYRVKHIRVEVICWCRGCGGVV